MKQLFLCVFASLFLISCRTEKTELKSPNGVEFFTSRTELTNAVQKAVSGDFGNISELSVKDIEYYEDTKQSVGLITYEINGVEHANLVIAVTPTSKKMYKCTAAGCACRAEIIKDSATGDILTECGGCNNDCHWEITP